jgi:hypothetical protein
MSGGFNPKVVNPYGYKAQTESGEFQTPFSLVVVKFQLV